MPRRRTTKPDASGSDRFTELDALLQDYVREPTPAAPTRRPPPPARPRAESVDPGRSRWSFERAAIRNSMRRRQDAPWYADQQDDEDRVA